MSTQNYGFLSTDNSNTKMQVFSPTAIVSVAAAGDVTVSTYNAVMFDAALTIYFGSDSSNTYDLPANVPLGVDQLTTINISAAANMLTM